MLTESSFQLLLARLDSDPGVAASRYEDLRIKIVHLLRWRGCTESHVEDLTDIAIDRIARKISEGEVIENLNAFAAGISRFVWLEHSRKNKIDAVGDDLPETAVEPDLSALDGDEPRLRCMRRCLSTSFEDDEKRLMLGYYDTDAGEKAKQARRSLAELFNLSTNALKVRACRLRSRLEACINDCVAGVTKPRAGDTYRQEVLER